MSNSATIRIAKQFPFLSCKTPKHVVDERKVLYLTVPPRYRYPHFHSRLHSINDTVLFEGVEFMAIFMKSEHIGSKRGLIQFSSARIRRLFWEYCFMERTEALSQILKEETLRLKKDGEMFFRSTDDGIQGNDANHLGLESDLQDESSRQVDYNNAWKRQNEMEANVSLGKYAYTDDYSIYESDLDFFHSIYKKHNWKPSYMVTPKSIYWEGYPIKVTTGSIVPLPKHAFNLKIFNLPEDCQEWMIDEWFIDAVRNELGIHSDTSTKYTLNNIKPHGSPPHDALHHGFQNDVALPKLRNRVIHLEEGGQPRNMASLNVSIKVKQVQDTEKNLETIADALTKLPILGEHVQVEIQQRNKSHYMR